MDNIELSSLIPASRQEYILEILRREKAVSVAQLAKRLSINEATIRRDLNRIEKSGLITRTYGGAVLTEGLDSEIPLQIRESENAEPKRCLARLAAECIQDGDSIFLDSSSSTEFIIPLMKRRKNLKIVTNGAKHAVMLSTLTDSVMYCTGGKLREHSLSYAGHAAAQALSAFHFGKAFISCRSLSMEEGLTDSCDEEAALRQIVIRHSQQTYLLADHSKLDQVSFFHIAPASCLYALITDLPPSKSWADFAADNGIRLLY